VAQRPQHAFFGRLGRLRSAAADAADGAAAAALTTLAALPPAAQPTARRATALAALLTAAAAAISQPRGTSDHPLCLERVAKHGAWVCVRDRPSPGHGDALPC
jgi:hypothetical protein